MIVAALTLGSDFAGADVPDCAVNAAISFPALGENPNVRVWQGDSLEEGLKLIGCEGWTPSDVNLVAAIAARISGDQTLDDIIGRIGNLEAYQSIQFWSFDRQQWEPMFDKAFALRGPDPEEQRERFSPEAMKTGAVLYAFLDESDRVSGMVQEFTVLERTDERFIVQSKNATAGKTWVVTVIEPDGTGGFVTITMGDDGNWDYYAITRVKYAGSSFFDIPDKALANRVTALYRYAAGIPTDKEPPTAP